MSEAVENISAVHEAHKREIAQLHSSANQQCDYLNMSPVSNTIPSHSLYIAKRETDSLQHTIQERNSEIRQLQKQLSDLERDKHTELVKLRLEVGSLFNGEDPAGVCKTCSNCSMMLSY